MKRNLAALIIIFFLNSCTDRPTEANFTTTSERISIFELYFKEPKSVDEFGVFLRDTLKLPVEWEPFDIFGNGVVYDAAYYFGNTTIELLALNQVDSTMSEPARFNRVLFESTDIGRNDEFLIKQGLQHSNPFKFNIFSDSSELQIGSQINLDSLSLLSNVNVAFWQYENSGFNFSERTISGTDELDLNQKLNEAFDSNPLGIIGLKEVHLTISESAKEDWTKLLGEPTDQQWRLKQNPTIEYDISEQSSGLDRMTIQVKDIKSAMNFLKRNSIFFQQTDSRIELDRSRFYGLNIWIEE